MKIYCAKCKKKTDTENINKITTKNNKAAIVGSCAVCTKKTYTFQSNKLQGSNIDIHKMIGKLLIRPQKGFVLPCYNYLGPYNALHKQVSFDENTGEIHKSHVQPKNKLDEIAMNHDICYTVNPSNKGDCDRKMVKSIDEMPYKDMNKTAMLARAIINKKEKLGLGYTKNDTKIEDTDRKQYAQEMHKRIIKKFRRRYVYNAGLDDIWTSDLILLPKYQIQNDGYKYSLTVMDVFSKYAWVRVTKNKDKITISNAFEDILKTSGRSPRRLWSDGGGEYSNNHFRKILKKFNIHSYSTQSKLKALMAERFN